MDEQPLHKGIVANHPNSEITSDHLPRSADPFPIVNSSKGSTVFVVHGRNEAARNAMFSFLRALSMRPLEWEQARDLTGQASPTTLDIVSAGIAAAQCVIVLLTGDDLARMDERFGTETLCPQPRPNVLFEAGWALATAGQARTVIVRFGSLRGLSDIDGLNYLILNNKPETRKALVKRLKSAGCVPAEDGTDYLSPSTGGDFNVEPATLNVIPGEFHRHADFIADAAIYIARNNLELYRRLDADLKANGRLELFYHYLGATCAQRWLDLCQHPDYGHVELVQTISQSAPPMVNALRNSLPSQNAPIDLVSLGTGDGETDCGLLHVLMANLNIGVYYCVDLSFELIQYALANIRKKPSLRDKFRTKAILGDFHELARLTPVFGFDNRAKLFCLTGYTFGNYDESRLLEVIRNSMRPGDFLFLDARLHELTDVENLDNSSVAHIKSAYSHDLNNRFAFGPVELATTANFEDASFEYEVNSRITVVPRALNVITSCERLNARLKSSGESINADRLDLAFTTLYSYQDLVTWLPRRGFQSVWTNATKNIGLFLLKRT
jgi:hypothetical protein